MEREDAGFIKDKENFSELSGFNSTPQQMPWRRFQQAGTARCKHFSSKIDAKENKICYNYLSG